MSTTPPDDSTELTVEELKAKLTARETEVANYKAQDAARAVAAKEHDKNTKLTAELAKHNLFESDMARQLLSTSVAWDETIQDWIAKNDQGAVRLDYKTLRPMKIEGLVQEFVEKHAYWVKPEDTATSAASSSQGQSTYKLEELFGPGSNAAAVNNLSLKNPEEYKRLRGLALEKGLICKPRR